MRQKTGFMEIDTHLKQSKYIYFLYIYVCILYIKINRYGWKKTFKIVLVLCHKGENISK